MGHGAKPPGDAPGGQFGFSVGRLVENGEAGLPFVQDEDVVAVFGEQHVIGFPMTRLVASFGLCGAFRDRSAMLDEAGRTTALARISPAPGFCAGQQAVPVILLA